MNSLRTVFAVLLASALPAFSVVDQEQLLTDGDQDWNSGAGQTFTAGIDGPLTHFSVLLTPRGNKRRLVVKLHHLNVNGAPTGAALATASLPRSVFTVGITAWYTFEFAAPYTQSVGEKLGIVFTLGAAPDPHGWFDFHHKSADPLRGGTLYYPGSLGWTGPGVYDWEDEFFDLAFYIKVGETTAPLQPPKISISQISGNRVDIRVEPSITGLDYVLQAFNVATNQWDDLDTLPGSETLVYWKLDILPSVQFYRVMVVDP